MSTILILFRIWKWTISRLPNAGGWVARFARRRVLTRAMLTASITLVLVMAPIGNVSAVGQTSNGESQAHIGPPFEHPPLWVEVEVDEIVLDYPGRCRGSCHPDSSHGVYGGFWEDPDYVIALRLEHLGSPVHADLKGTAWRNDYDDEYDAGLTVEDGRIVIRGPDFPNYGTKRTQVLYDKEDGIGGEVLINEFAHPSGGWDSVRSTGSGTVGSAVGKTRNERFVFYGPDRYDHIHCSPTQDLKVSFVVLESDDNSGIQATAIGAGALVSVVGGLATGGSLPVVLTTTGLSTGASEAINRLAENDDDVVGVGQATLKENGRTEVDIVGGEWNDENELVARTGTTRGHITFETRTRTMEEALTSWDASEFTNSTVMNDVPESFDQVEYCSEGTGIQPGETEDRIGSETPVETPEGNVDQSDESAYYDSMKSSLRLAIRLQEDGLPVGAVPRNQRRLVIEGVNVHVGTAGVGMVFDETGELTRTTPSGLEGPALTVWMSPEVATELAYTDDVESTVRMGVERGDIRVRGNGPRNRAVVGMAKAALVTQRS